jgi:hypothetical protein
LERAAFAAAALMVAHQAVMAVYAIRTADENRAVIDAFQRGQRSDQMLTMVYPDLAKAEALSDRLRRDGFYQHELRAASAP